MRKLTPFVLALYAMTILSTYHIVGLSGSYGDIPREIKNFWVQLVKSCTQKFNKYELLSLRSFDRASAFASAAVNALISIDNILSVFFCDAAYGADLRASTAAETFFSIDLMCHSF